MCGPSASSEEDSRHGDERYALVGTKGGQQADHLLEQEHRMTRHRLSGEAFPQPQVLFFYIPSLLFSFEELE